MATRGSTGSELVTGLGWLLAFQVAGLVCQTWFGLSVPAPVLGFFLLALALQLGWVRLAQVERTADLLLSHLLLLFTPVVVGLLPHLALLRQNGLGLVLSLVAGTAAVMAVTGWTAQALLGKRAGRSAGSGRDVD